MFTKRVCQGLTVDVLVQYIVKEIGTDVHVTYIKQDIVDAGIVVACPYTQGERNQSSGRRTRLLARKSTVLVGQRKSPRRYVMVSRTIDRNSFRTQGKEVYRHFLHGRS